MKRTGATLLWHLPLLLLAVATAFPLVWMLSASFMAPGESTTLPPPLLPSHPTLENYRALFERLAMGRALLNSLLIAGGTTLLSLALNSMAGYAFARLRFSGRDRLFAWLLGGLVIPAQVGTLPLFLLLRGLGWVNTYVGVIVPVAVSIFGIFLIRQFALGIPEELVDAARVDGASEWRIFRSLILPLLRPALLTLGLIQFMGTWNDFLWPLIVLSDDARHTLPVALASLVGEHAQDPELMMAGSVITVLPVLVLFIVLQRQYIDGLLAGSVKG